MTVRPCIFSFQLHFKYINELRIVVSTIRIRACIDYLYSQNALQGRSWAFFSFKPATRMLLIYAYQFTQVEDQAFTGRKVTLVGPLSYNQFT